MTTKRTYSSALLTEIIPPAYERKYRDSRGSMSPQEWDEHMRSTTTLYVGNLSFFTTDEQIVDWFSKIGPLRRVIMGLNRQTFTPCGFCFVEYCTREDAEKCLMFTNGLRLDDRVVRVDWDAGFLEGRQFGRGKQGGQIRDDYRDDYDPERGGFGGMAERRVVSQQPYEHFPQASKILSQHVGQPLQQNWRGNEPNTATSSHDQQTSDLLKNAQDSPSKISKTNTDTTTSTTANNNTDLAPSTSHPSSPPVQPQPTTTANSNSENDSTDQPARKRQRTDDNNNNNNNNNTITTTTNIKDDDKDNTNDNAAQQKEGETAIGRGDEEIVVAGGKVEDMDVQGDDIRDVDSADSDNDV